jgi:hypothetical protein
VDIAATIDVIRPSAHLLLHICVPAAVAWRWGGRHRFRVFVLLMTSMLIDLDHLIADPIYAPGRCSIGFHPLHRWPALLVYMGLAISKPARWFGLGALIHLGLDTLDCLMMG